MIVIQQPDPISNEWREVAGFGGRYQVSREGQIRVMYKRQPPRIMKPRAAGINGRSSIMIGLKTPDGKRREISVARIVAEAYIRPLREGEVVYHLNRIHTDNHAGNLQIVMKSEKASQWARNSKAQPVARIDRNGEIIKIFPSARAAALESYMDRQTVADHCNGFYLRKGQRITHKTVFAMDGYAYAWDDDRSIRRVQRAIAKETNRPVNTNGYQSL